MNSLFFVYLIGIIVCLAIYVFIMGFLKKEIELPMLMICVGWPIGIPILILIGLLYATYILAQALRESIDKRKHK